MNVVTLYYGSGWYGSAQVGNHIEESRIPGANSSYKAREQAKLMGLGCVKFYDDCPKIGEGKTIYNFGHLCVTPEDTEPRWMALVIRPYRFRLGGGLTREEAEKMLHEHFKDTDIIRSGQKWIDYSAGRKWSDVSAGSEIIYGVLALDTVDSHIVI
jgi:hypothetical protein